MPRRQRSFQAAAPVHLTANGVDGQAIFRADFDRFAFLSLLKRVTERVRWHIAAWCLMDTHYHLVVFPGADPRVSWAMQLLNGVYAREFNERHDRRGHLFRERFAHREIATDAHLAAACDYVLDNPVRAGIVRNALDWPWSGDHLLEPRPCRNVTEPARIRDKAVRRPG
jgi:REP element-mobilizing transposase RayT